MLNIIIFDHLNSNHLNIIVKILLIYCLFKTYDEDYYYGFIVSRSLSKNLA